MLMRHDAQQSQAGFPRRLSRNKGVKTVSYNGSGVFNINTAGQPVVTGTVISSTAFNALTSDLGTGLSTAITKDGQTVATARIPFAAGINSSLVTDATSTTTGSIITAGGAGIAKSLYVGTGISGALNGTVGATTPSTGAFTTVTTTTSVAVGGSTLSGSGSGVQFPATQSASADANTLDDYEEGTWTATLTASITAPTVPVTVTGYYRKIGALVYIQAGFAGVSTVGGVGQTRITGLPFSVSQIDGPVAPLLLYNFTLAGKYAVAQTASTARIDCFEMNSAAAWTALDISAGLTRFLYISMTYMSTT